MIVPTVGRIVWFRPDAVFIPTLDGQPNGPLAAIIVGVQSEERVNVSVFGADGSMHPRTGVFVTQEGDPAPGSCTWMPFQKGQATNLAGAADGIGAKVEEHLAAAKAAIEQHTADIVAELKRYFAAPVAEDAKRAENLARLKAGTAVLVERPDKNGFDIVDRPSTAPAVPVGTEPKAEPAPQEGTAEQAQPVEQSAPAQG